MKEVNRMKRIIGFVIICAMILSFSCCASEKAEVDTTAGEGLLSSFAAVDTDGNIVDQSILKDCKLTMINVWGTFCGPCIREMPDLAALNDKYAERGFQIIGIPMDVVDNNLNKIPEKIAEMNEIIETTGANYRHLIPSKSLNDALLSSLLAVPASFFFDKEGRLIGDVYMGARSGTEWETVINSILESME